MKASLRVLATAACCLTGGRPYKKHRNAELAPSQDISHFLTFLQFAKILQEFTAGEEDSSALPDCFLSYKVICCT